MHDYCHFIWIVSHIKFADVKSVTVKANVNRQACDNKNDGNWDKVCVK